MVNDPDSSLRILFLDDDHKRARIFLAVNPQAIWVETVPDCLAKLEETWDEVHLDHDLGGEQYVLHDRDDCGMEVVRWLSLAPRPHLKLTKFVVHSHNPNGATMMGMQLMVNGYNVEVRPFGETPVVPSTSSSSVPTPPPPPPPPSTPQNGPRQKSFLESLRYRLQKMIYPSPPGLDPAMLEQIRAIAERRAQVAQAKAEEKKAAQPDSSSLGTE
jgi:hypothetical protein